MQTSVAAYPWAKELEKTVTQSLFTSFGLDFMLFGDKKGGNVDTIHNVRQGTWATEQERENYAQREEYSSTKYHTHENYIETGRRDKKLQERGELHDSYRNLTMGADEKRDLDHVISAKEIHDDPGRVLAEANGVELANKSSNLQSTSQTVNRSKKQSSVDDYLNKRPGLLENHENTLKKKQEKLAGLPRGTPQQQHEARELESEIRETKKKIDELKSIDPEEMRKKDYEARAGYERTINVKYYTDSKFISQAAKDAGFSGLRMGTRQMLGLILAECWFELRESIPKIIKNLQDNFKLETFIQEMKETLEGIWIRVKNRFTEFLTSFKDGVFAGVMSSATTTLFNIFATTQKQIVKLIREIWGYLLKAIKLIFFNPDQLPFVDLCQAVVSIISAGAAMVIGTGVYTEVAVLLNFPLGTEVAAFIGSLATGIVTLGLNYFLLYSDFAKKIWDFIANLSSNVKTLQEFRAINIKLDKYLSELAQLEFNMDTDELERFTHALEASNNELERSFVIQQEISKRNIVLPYEMGKPDTVLKFLVSKAT